MSLSLVFWVAILFFVGLFFIFRKLLYVFLIGLVGVFSVASLLLIYHGADSFVGIFSTAFSFVGDFLFAFILVALVRSLILYLISNK